MQCQSDERRRKLDQRQCPREIKCRNIGEGYRNLFSKDEDQVAEEKNRTKSIPFRDISKTASLFPRGGKTESLGYRVEWRGSLFRLTASSHARIAYTSVSTDTTRPLCPSPPLSNVHPQTRSKFPMKI